MWLFFLGLTLLTGDVLSQALKVTNSETDLTAAASDQLIHSSAELLAVEDKLFDLPFGTRLPGYEQPIFAYSYTVDSDDNISKFVKMQRTDPTDKNGAHSHLQGSQTTDSANNVIYLSNLNLPGRNIDNKPIENASQEEITKIYYNTQSGTSEEENDKSGDTVSSKEILEYHPSRYKSEHLPPKNLAEDFLPKELTEILPPKTSGDLSAEQISDHLPPKKILEYFPPKELVGDISSKETKVRLSPVPPKMKSSAGFSIEEITEYLPPKDTSEAFISKDITDYLPPKEITEYLRPKEITEYLPPKEITEYLPPKELTEYLPPEEIKELAEYLPPREVSETLPPKEISTHVPPDSVKISGEITKHPDSTLSLFIKETSPIHGSTEKEIEAQESVVAGVKGVQLHLVPPVRDLHSVDTSLVSDCNDCTDFRAGIDNYEDPFFFNHELKEYVSPNKKFKVPDDNNDAFKIGKPSGTAPKNEKFFSTVTTTDSQGPKLFVTPDVIRETIKNEPVIAISETPKLTPYAVVKERKEVPVKAVTERKKFEPLSVEGSYVDENIVAKAERPRVDPYAVDREISIQQVKPKIKVSAPPHAVIREKVQQKISPTASAALHPYAVVGERKETKITPVRSSTRLTPYAVIEERRPLPITVKAETSKVSSTAIPDYSRVNYMKPKPQRQRVTPYAVTEKVKNQPIIPQSVESKHDIPVSADTKYSVRPPFKSTYQQLFSVVAEKDKGCLANDECSGNEICEHGTCILGCSIARGLCINTARCETRHHVPACICPLMFTASTVRGSDYVQFDCTAMTMPAFHPSERQSPTRIRPFTYNRPVVAPVRQTFGVGLTPVRGSAIRDTAGPPAFPSRSSACNPSPCGPNTRCEVNRNGIALCRCIDDYVPDGNTINGCKPQCVTDSECPDDYQCTRQKCERVCVPGACGLNADCDSRNHRAVCSCPTGYSGQADSRCTRTVPQFDEPEPLQVDPCFPNPCGDEGECKPRGERPVCSCPRGYEGDPLKRCIRGECLEHNDCSNHLACQNLRCIDPCSGVCGTSSECTVRDHQPICSCPRNFLGDPFVTCRAITEYDICNPSPCGRSTNCKVRHDRSGSMRAVCSCIDNYIGDPLTECKPECVRDTDCASNQHCRDNRCRNPCIDGCGEGAYCDARNNRAVCTCPEFFSGDPHSRCYPECTKHEDCPDYQACYQFSCIDPCKGACGTGADCKVETHTPICSCPRGYTGDPFISCRAFTLEDLCANNPCGAGAECHPGKDRSGNDRPVCVCPTGYIGNPLVSCQRGECQAHSECPDHQACYAYMCQSPCYTETGSVCGENALCRVRDHTPVCSCPKGYDGNPLSECRISRSARIAGHLRT